MSSGAYGLDFTGSVATGSSTQLVLLGTTTNSNWEPSANTKVTGVYSSIGGTTASPTNQSTINEKSGSANFPTFKSWTFVDANNGDKALATNTVAQSITESALLQKELEVGYDLNGDLVVGNGIFSVALLSKEYLDEIGQVKKSPGVVRLSSGEFGIVLEGNDYSEGDGNSFVLTELVSSGNAWTPFTEASTQGYDYFISGAERLENNDLKSMNYEKVPMVIRMSKSLHLPNLQLIQVVIS